MASLDAATVRSAVPTFIVADVARTADWYRDRLAFRVAGMMPKPEPYAYASLQLVAAELMLLSLPGHEKPDLRGARPSGSWDAYIRVDGVHALFDTAAGGRFVQMPLTRQPYGDREFEVRDPNGYVLVFGGGY